jgi:hypothetical protein
MGQASGVQVVPRPAAVMGRDQSFSSAPAGVGAWGESNKGPPEIGRQEAESPRSAF